MVLEFWPRSPARRWLGLPPPVPPTDMEEAALQHYNAGRSAAGAPPARLETALCDVARAYARLLAAYGSAVAASAVDTLMDWVGLVDPYPAFVAWRSPGGGDGPFLLRLRRLGQRAGPAPSSDDAQGHHLIGVGRCPGPDEWTYVLVRVTRLVALTPLPRRHAPGAELDLRGRLVPGIHGARGFTLAPGERLRTLKLRHLGEGAFQAGRLVPETPGRFVIEFTGRSKRGPLVLARLALLVQHGDGEVAPARTVPSGGAGGLPEPEFAPAPSWDPLDPALLPGVSAGPETCLRLLLPPPDDAALNPEQARERLLAVINSVRARTGLPTLDPDRLAAAVAQRHAEEMASRGFTGHLSPRSGSPGDRFRKAGLAVTLLGECVARDRSVCLAYFALMRSLAHRAALLDRRFLGVGLGAACPPTSPQPEILVACELLRPLVHPEPARSGAELAQEIAFQRAARQHIALQHAADLRQAAVQATLLAARKPSGAGAPLKALLESSLGARGPGGWQDYAALVRGLTDPLALSTESDLLEQRWTHMGLHVRRLDNRRDGVPVCVVAVVLGQRARD